MKFFRLWHLSKKFYDFVNCLINFNISLAMGGTMESAVGISAGFSPLEQYRDPVLYARITHNYTLQKSIAQHKEKQGRA